MQGLLEKAGRRLPYGNSPRALPVDPSLTLGQREVGLGASRPGRGETVRNSNDSLWQRSGQVGRAASSKGQGNWGHLPGEHGCALSWREPGGLRGAIARERRGGPEGQVCVACHPPCSSARPPPG